MESLVTNIGSVHECGGSLASLKATPAVSSLAPQTSVELVVKNDDGEFDFDVGETAT